MRQKEKTKKIINRAPNPFKYFFQNSLNLPIPANANVNGCGYRENGTKVGVVPIDLKILVKVVWQPRSLSGFCLATPLSLH